MERWAGTRAEREWLGCLRRLAEQVERLADAAERIASELERQPEEGP